MEKHKVELLNKMELLNILIEASKGYGENTTMDVSMFKCILRDSLMKLERQFASLE